MTVSTEQLHQLLELVLTELDRKAIPIAYMQEIDRKGKAFIEQAARRAPAVPVPQVTPEMIEAALEAYMPFGDMELAIQCALAAAPQPPEAAQLDDTNVVDMPQAVDLKEVATVQMPEPRIYWIEATTQFCIKRGGEVPFASAWEPLYTEQQVLDLLAANGIEVAP